MHTDRKESNRREFLVLSGVASLAFFSDKFFGENQEQEKPREDSSLNKEEYLYGSAEESSLLSSYSFPARTTILNSTIVAPTSLLMQFLESYCRRKDQALTTWTREELDAELNFENRKDWWESVATTKTVRMLVEEGIRALLARKIKIAGASVLTGLLYSFSRQFSIGRTDPDGNKIVPHLVRNKSPYVDGNLVTGVFLWGSIKATGFIGGVTGRIVSRICREGIINLKIFGNSTRAREMDDS